MQHTQHSPIHHPQSKERNQIEGRGTKHTNTILLNQVLGLGFRGRHSGGGRAGKGAEQTGEDGSDGDGFTLVVKGKEVLLKIYKSEWGEGKK